jgi:zinc transport system ATP-binding protein
MCCLSRRPAFLGIGKTMRQTILECLDRVHGCDLIDKRIGALSGGELQRVLLALALEPLPNILILDEPLSGVDVEGMETLMEMLDEIRHTYDLSILMTTHDFSMLPRYADQVVLIDHSIVRKGSAADVLESEDFRRVFHMRGGEAK